MNNDLGRSTSCYFGAIDGKGVEQLDTNMGYNISITHGESGENYSIDVFINDDNEMEIGLTNKRLGKPLWINISTITPELAESIEQDLSKPIRVDIKRSRPNKAITSRNRSRGYCSMNKRSTPNSKLRTLSHSQRSRISHNH